MSSAARLEKLPDWPARMTAASASRYLDMSEGSFLARYRTFGKKEGGNVYWSRRQLDELIDAQFGIKQSPAPRRETDTWADL